MYKTLLLAAFLLPVLRCYSQPARNEFALHHNGLI